MRLTWTIISLILGAGWAIAQIPTPMPPMLLPGSVTNQPAGAGPVRPTAAAVPQQQAVAPIMRFTQNLAAFPPETVQTVYGVRAGADWLWRMNQANGRFFYGLSPAVRRALDGDHDVRQVIGAQALAEAARFTGDERLTARATQTVLALLAQTRQEPTTATDKANRCGLQAGVVLAIYALPEVDAKLLEEAEKLVTQLRGRFDTSGALRIVDEGATPDPETAALVPGVVLQALAQSNTRKPEEWKREIIAKSAGMYRTALKQRSNNVVAAGILPAVVELALATNKDASLCAMAFELADSLCEGQYGRAETPPVGWFGGFRASVNSQAEPTADSAVILSGLTAAMKLTRRVPDVNRYVKYRTSVVDGLNFCKNLQFSDENSEHFEKSFRSRFLIGAAHLSPSDGTVRVDATAQVVMAYLMFLSSGGETKD